MSQYFPKPYEPFSGDINVKVDLSNYATKADIKDIWHVGTSSFSLKTNLANLKTEVGKLDIDKLKPVPIGLSKLSNVVKNDVVKKNDYNKLVTKVNSIDTSGFVLKTKYDTDKSELENKAPDTSGLAKITSYNTKITELENKIPDISNLVTKTALTTVENKIPNISSLVKKSDYNTKISSLDGKIDKINFDTKKKYQEFFFHFLWGVWCLILKVVLKLIQYFNHHVDILKRLLILVIFHHGNLNDYLLKLLKHLQHLIIVLIQN